MIISVKRGDIVLVPFPFTGNATLFKSRPAIVVQDDNLQTGLPDTIVAAITSQRFRGGLPCRVLIQLNDPGMTVTGLRTDSVIMLDKLLTIHRNRIIGHLGIMPSMQAVDQVLRVVFGV